MALPVGAVGLTTSLLQSAAKAGPPIFEARETDSIGAFAALEADLDSNKICARITLGHGIRIV